MISQILIRVDLRSFRNFVSLQVPWYPSDLRTFADFRTPESYRDADFPT